MTRARDVIFDPEHLYQVWQAVEESDRPNNAHGVKRELADRLEGNVFIYEIRTALDEYGMRSYPTKLCSRGIRLKIKRLNGE